MHKIRVFVVDDEVAVRSRLAKVLSSDPELEVVGAAANGRIALAKIPRVNPDVVLLDVEMPEMDGLETLTAIRKTYPLLPVIALGTFSGRQPAVTLKALSLGATNYATMPTKADSSDAAIQHIRENLISKIKVIGSSSQRLQMPTVNPKSIAAPTRLLTKSTIAKEVPAGRTLTTTVGSSPSRVEVVAIGGSIGGPNALAVVLPELPADLPVPIVIVQHMPPMFTKLLAERLASKCQIRVDEAVSGAVLEPGHAWIAPGDFHMIVSRNAKVVRIKTHQEPPENSCRPAVDVLFRSVADVYGGGAIAVVLTGMGQDGLRGCKCIREVGGQILAQDEATSVVWGMPGFVANAGLADKVLPLDQIGGEIMRRVKQNRAKTGD